jgi:hypothetical protein
MIVVVYQVLSRKEEYVEFGGDYYPDFRTPRGFSNLPNYIRFACNTNI